MSQFLRTSWRGALACGLAVAVAAANAEQAPEPEDEALQPAQEAAPAPKKQARPLSDMTLRGTVFRQEVERKGQTRTMYKLKLLSGELVSLPRAKGLNLDDYVNQDVVVSGQGFQMERNGKTVVSLKNIVDLNLSEQLGDEPEPADDEAL